MMVWQVPRSSGMLVLICALLALTSGLDTGGKLSVKRRGGSNINISNVVNNLNNDINNKKNLNVYNKPKADDSLAQPAPKILAPAVQRAQQDALLAEAHRQKEKKVEQMLVAHERAVAKQQADMSGREAHRAHKQVELEAARIQQLQQNMDAQQELARGRVREEERRVRDHALEKAKEEQWLADMKRRAEVKVRERQEADMVKREAEARRALGGGGGGLVNAKDVPRLKNAGVQRLGLEEGPPRLDKQKQPATNNAKALLSKDDIQTKHKPMGQARDSVDNDPVKIIQHDQAESFEKLNPKHPNVVRVPVDPELNGAADEDEDKQEKTRFHPEPPVMNKAFNDYKDDNSNNDNRLDNLEKLKENDALHEAQKQYNNIGNNDVNSFDNNNNGFANNNNNGFGNNNNNNGFANNNNHQQQHQQQNQIGGMQLAWDWDDFSIMFKNYGNAEQKVRRAPHPTTGEPWPMPQYYSKKDKRVYKVSKDLKLVPTGVKCDILEVALERHLSRTLHGAVEDMYDNLQNAEGTFIDDPSLKYDTDLYRNAPTVSRVEIKVRKPCEKYPTLESDESYDLVVKKKKSYIWANEVWGAMRGLETLGQLVWRGTDGHLYIKETVVSDYPRFPHRGLHIDTSRHFLFKEILLDIIDSMEMNKLNVFHWHIVDDQSFPYESQVYPEMSRKGAFHPKYVYSLEDIAEIIEYARIRGVRVLPEFDSPGHTYSWGLSRPELLTQCYSGSQPVKGYLGPIDPSKNSTYRFLKTLFQEIMGVFKDQFLHLGGDEVPLGCWQSNPEVMAFAAELSKKKPDQQNPVNQYNQNNYNNYGGGGGSMYGDEIKMVYEHYVNRLIKTLNELGQNRKKGVRYIMWQEVMNNNLQLPNDTIIQVWMGDMADVMRATSLGYQVLYSTCWYLDHVEYGTKWPKYYQCDPVDQTYGYHIDEKKVLGGEIAFWSEYFSNENLIPLMWPRASAAAERLWSNRDVKNLDQAAVRLSEHRCRMIKRGVNAGEISGPGYCLHAPPRRRSMNDTLCKGSNCTRTHVVMEDIEVHVSQRGASLANCGQMFQTSSPSLVLSVAVVSLLVLLALLAVSRSSPRLHRLRACRNRYILILLVLALVVYFLCYTTIWMRAFEFSGSIHKTRQEDDNGMGEFSQGDDS